MGRLKTTPGFHAKQRGQHRAFFSSIHRARVSDTASAVTKGTVNAIIENTDHIITVLAPLLSLSLPPKGVNTDGEIDQSDDNGAKAGWGRYIPQVGDMLLVGFDTNGDPYALGYHAVYLPALDTKDKEASDRGGIGWGEESGVKLEPGDWDFMSKRSARMMLTDKVQLSSGPYVFSLDQSQGESVLTSTLARTQYGEASEERKGGVRRFLLPTDTEETDVYGIFASIAQESTDVVKRGAITGGIEMARTSMGEVIDELTFLPMVPVTTYPDLSLMTGTGTRIFRAVKDPSGVTELYSELIDDLGNYGVSASTAIAFQWFTPAASWNILNVQTDWTSSGAFNLTVGGDLGITAANATITAGQLALGGSSAVDYLVKGTTFVSALKVYLALVTTAFSKLAGDVGLAAIMDPATASALSAASVGATTISNSLDNMLSTITKTV